ncbi:MAG: hypothetical protein Q9226_003243 [Calogaya cf. arnoldii]
MGSLGEVDFSSPFFETFPALPPPPGVRSNFDNPVTRGPDVVIASSICLTLMLSLVVMRFYTKIAIKRKLGWDDWLCIPATVRRQHLLPLRNLSDLEQAGAIGFAAVSITLVHQAVGPHQWDVPVSHFTKDVLRKFIVVDVIYSPAILMAKLSLLSLYLQVFRPNPRLRYAIHFGMVFVTLFYTGTFIAFCVLAIPQPGESLIGKILSNDVASLIPISVAQGGVNVASDLYIFLLPIPGVMQLQMPTRKKIGVCAIFATGSLACLASIMGLYYRTRLKRDSDVTWSLVDILIWVVIELHVGVMCGCMPALAGFFNHYLPILRSFGSSISSRVKGISFLRISSRPSSSESSSKRLATKDIHMTLGSRVDGQGQFINTQSVFASEENWLKPGRATHNPRSLARNPSGTRREWHEGMAELKRQSLASHPPMVRMKPSSQTRTRSLTIHDEEMGTPIYGIPSGEIYKAPQHHSGYF